LTESKNNCDTKDFEDDAEQAAPTVLDSSKSHVNKTPLDATGKEDENVLTEVGSKEGTVMVRLPPATKAEDCADTKEETVEESELSDYTAVLDSGVETAEENPKEMLERPQDLSLPPSIETTETRSLDSQPEEPESFAPEAKKL
jgi:hypothetical protein